MLLVRRKETERRKGKEMRKKKGREGKRGRTGREEGGTVRENPVLCFLKP